MRKLFISACMLFAALAFAPTTASAQLAPGGGSGGGGGGGGSPVGGWIFMGCVTALIIAAADANNRKDRELTAGEAWMCGIPYWFATDEKKRRRRHVRAS